MDYVNAALLVGVVGVIGLLVWLCCMFHAYKKNGRIGYKNVMQTLLEMQEAMLNGAKCDVALSAAIASLRAELLHLGTKNDCRNLMGGTEPGALVRIEQKMDGLHRDLLAEHSDIESAGAGMDNVGAIPDLRSAIRNLHRDTAQWCSPVVNIPTVQNLDGRKRLKYKTTTTSYTKPTLKTPKGKKARGK